jgi:hypothetical protein
MIGKRFLLTLVTLLTAAVVSETPRVNTEQTAPCANVQTADKTDKQNKLDSCSCQQAAAHDQPTYRVGAAPFGRNVALRVGKSARTRARRGKPAAEPEDLYEGLEMPDRKDLQSPEVVGLQEKVLRAREGARQRVEESLARARKVLQLQPRNWLANRTLNSPRARKAYEQFIALQNNGSWVSWPKFDWRAQGLDVGPVLHQGSCASCWAFTAVSVYQSSWNLEQLRLGDKFFTETVPEYGSHQRIPSVQQLLNCIGKEKGNCGGGWHGTAFAFMISSHVPHIPDRLVWNKGDQASIEEYTGRVSRCTDLLRTRKVKRGGKMAVPGVGGDGSELPANSDLILTAYDRALAWGYVNEQKPDLPTIAQLKQALIKHGPLAMPIHGDDCFSVYQGGIFNGQRTGAPNHVMVLIGWDDEKQAWLIKNSWGENWGEQGFGWVKYGSNSIGHYAAWIQPTPATADR